MLRRLARRIQEKKFRIVVLLLVGAILGTGLWNLATGVHQLSAYEDKWSDISDFRRSLERRGMRTSSLISSIVLLNSSEGAPALERVLVVLGVERPYLAPELETIADFVDRGGYLLLADDFGYGNPLADRFGVSFSGRRLWSSEFMKNPSFVRVCATLEGASYSVLLDQPTALEKVSSADTVVSTFPDSWLDENGNGERDLDESSAAFPVAAFVRHGDGAVLAFSDPGLFINDLWDREDNSAFVLACLKKYFKEAREFIFDETRHVPDTVREGAWRTGLLLEVLLLNNSAGKGFLAGVIVVALVVGVARIRSPAEWRHEDTLRTVTLHHLSEPRFTSEDRKRLKHVLLEKVRLALNLYPDEFAALGRDRLASALGDERLLAFVDDPSSVSLFDMDEMLDRVRGWGRA